MTKELFQYRSLEEQRPLEPYSRTCSVINNVGGGVCGSWGCTLGAFGMQVQHLKLKNVKLEDRGSK